MKKQESFILNWEVDQNTSATKGWTTILNANARLWMTCVLLTSDVLCLLVAILTALQVRGLPHSSLDQSYPDIFILLTVMLITAFARGELYPAIGLSFMEEMREVVSGTSFTFLILIGITFLLKTSTIYSRLIFLLIWVFSLVLIPSGRYLARRWLIHLHLWGEPVAIIGASRQDPSLTEYLEINPRFGLRPVVVLHDEYFFSDNFESGPLLSIDEIKDYAHKTSLNTALVVINDLNHLDTLVDRYRFVFHRIILVKNRNDSYLLHNLKPLDFSDILGLQVKNNLLSFRAQLTKRIIDVLGSFLGLLFLSPFFGLVFLLIKVDSLGGVLYRQPRLGRKGKVFSLLKFRTMRQDADRILAEYLAHNPELKREWDQYQKLKEDPRITRVGRLLRKFSLDELPQLWNVLIGEMSLVGPRPMLINQRELYGDTFNEYVRTTPGMTGLWQVSGRNYTTFARRAELDREYIQRWSVWLDVFILVKTIKIMFWQHGTY